MNAWTHRCWLVPCPRRNRLPPDNDPSCGHRSLWKPQRRARDSLLPDSVRYLPFKPLDRCPCAAVCGSRRVSAMIDKKLLSILVYPVSKAELEYHPEKQELVCWASGLAYPIRDGIPVMLES